MWCTHRPKPRKRGRDQREHHGHDSRTRGRRANVGTIAEIMPSAGQEDDVDLGMAEEPEQVLPQQRVAALGRVEELRADQPVGDQERCCASITDGMANRIMNDVTSIAQTNSGMRLSVMPGARSLKTVAMIWIGAEQRRHLGEGDQLRPEVGALAGAVLRARRAARS